MELTEYVDWDQHTALYASAKERKGMPESHDLQVTKGHRNPRRHAGIRWLWIDNYRGSVQQWYLFLDGWDGF